MWLHSAYRCTHSPTLLSHTFVAVGSCFGVCWSVQQHTLFFTLTHLPLRSKHLLLCPWWFQSAHNFQKTHSSVTHTLHQDQQHRHWTPPCFIAVCFGSQNVIVIHNTGLGTAAFKTYLVVNNVSTATMENCFGAQRAHAVSAHSTKRHHPP